MTVDDSATPTTARRPSPSDELVTLEIDGVPVTVPAGTSVMRAAVDGRRQGPEALRHRQPRSLRLVPPVPRRDRRPQGFPGLVHHAGRAGMKVRTQSAEARRAAPRRDGAVHLRPSARLPDLLRPTATASCRTWPASVGLREVRYGYDGANHLDATKDESQPVLHVRSQQVHRLLALRARLRGNAGHVRADHRRPRLRLAGRPPGQDEPFMDSECVSCGACVQACPTATLMEKSVIAARPARAQRRSPPAPTAASAARSRPR